MEIEKGILSSVVSALDMMIFMAARGSEIGVTEIANHFGVSKTKAFRLLNTLRSRGFVEQNGDNSRYRIGPRAFEVGSGYISQLDVLQVAHPVMEDLVRMFDQKTNLAVLDKSEGEIVYVKFVDCERAVRVVTHLGSRAPLTCTALGKAFLAEMDWEQAGKLIAKKGVATPTKKSLRTLDDLRREFAEIKHRGYAVDDEENYPEVRCVAAVVRDHEGEVTAALSLSSSILHLPMERMSEFGNAVKAAASAISERLRYTGNRR